MRTTLSYPHQVSERVSSRSLALHFSERKLLLAVVDIALVNGALAMALGWRFNQSPNMLVAVQPSWFLILTAAWLGVSLLSGSYGLRRASQVKEAMGIGAVTSITAAIVYLLIPYVTPPLPTSRSSLALFLGAVVVAVTAWRAFYALVLVRPALRRKALVIGAGWAGTTIVQAIADHAPGEYEVAGLVDDDPTRLGDVVGDWRVLGTHEDLERLILRTGASEVIVAMTQPDTMSTETFQAIMDCHERGVPVTQMHILYEQLTGRVPVEHAGRNLAVVLPLNGAPSHIQATAKRLLDLLIASAGLILMALLVPLVWLAHRCESRGPLFYAQRRVGQGGRIFDLLKFRTMCPDAEADGPRWAQVHDDRITRTGRILRRLHLDEAPQALNILRGDLSFVGPRPERPEFVMQLEREIPFYRARHAVRPGITGWAQVNYPYGASVEDAHTKLQYDLYYIKHQSVWLDLLILGKTVGLILTLGGR